jgi:hypothetical protein
LEGQIDKLTEEDNKMNIIHRRTAVLVLGDVGRSPRMQYHCISLAKIAGMEVDLIGYSGTTSSLEHLSVSILCKLNQAQEANV